MRCERSRLFDTGAPSQSATRRLVTLVAIFFSPVVISEELPFPSTPILDDFNRPDEGSPGGPMWIASLSPEFPDHPGFSVINSKAAAPSIQQSASSSWIVMFPESQEAYYEYGDTPGTNAGMGPAVRLQDATDFQSDQYLVFFYQGFEANQSQVRIWKRSQGSWTNPSTNNLNTSLKKGDQIGIRAVGATVEAFLNGEVVSAFVDPQPILDPGFIQLYVGDDVGHTGDNFGGGAVDFSVNRPQLSMPPPGGVFSGSSVLFQWTADGALVSQWRLSVGSTEGSTDIADESLGTDTATTLSSLPTDGAVLWVRLSYLLNGRWYSKDYQYTAAAFETNSKPEITVPNSQLHKVGESVEFQIIASDADGDVLLYSATGLPSGLEIDASTGRIQGVATAANSYNVTVDVSDGQESASASFEWIIASSTSPDTRQEEDGGSGALDCFILILLLGSCGWSASNNTRD